jgi:hypothetical protein
MLELVDVAPFLARRLVRATEQATRKELPGFLAASAYATDRDAHLTSSHAGSK